MNPILLLLYYHLSWWHIGTSAYIPDDIVSDGTFVSCQWHLTSSDDATRRPRWIKYRLWYALIKHFNDDIIIIISHTERCFCIVLFLISLNQSAHTHIHTHKHNNNYLVCNSIFIRVNQLARGWPSMAARWPWNFIHHQNQRCDAICQRQKSSTERHSCQNK